MLQGVQKESVVLSVCFLSASGVFWCVFGAGLMCTGPASLGPSGLLIPCPSVPVVFVLLFVAGICWGFKGCWGFNC